MEATKFNWLAQAISVMAVSTGKVSVAILIGRIMGPGRWRKWLLYFLSITSFALACVVIIIMFVQCSPSRALWEDPIGKCWDLKITINICIAVAGMYRPFHVQLARLILCVAYDIAVDLALAIIPTTFIWKLNLDFRKKLALSGLLGFGVL